MILLKLLLILQKRIVFLEIRKLYIFKYIYESLKYILLFFLVKYIEIQILNQLFQLTYLYDRKRKHRKKVFKKGYW